MHKLLTVILISVSSVAFAQNISRLDSAIINLKADGVDTFIVFNTIADNLPIIYTDDICLINNNQVYFLYWIFKGDISVVMIDNCYKYAPIVKLNLRL